MWLRRAYKNGVNVAVIIGWEKGGVVFHGVDWLEALSKEAFIERSMSKKEIAQWIQSQVYRKPRRSLAA